MKLKQGPSGTNHDLEVNLNNNGHNVHIVQNIQNVPNFHNVHNVHIVYTVTLAHNFHNVHNVQNVHNVHPFSSCFILFHPVSSCFILFQEKPRENEEKQGQGNQCQTLGVKFESPVVLFSNCMINLDVLLTNFKQFPGIKISHHNITSKCPIKMSHQNI